MLINSLTDYDPDITALQEIGWVGTRKMRKPNWDLYYSGHEQQHIFGTGFLVGKRANQRIIGFTPIDMRICVLRMEATFYNISIINAHAPSEDKEDNEKEIFYEALERTYDNCPKNNLKIIIGDMNAKIGKEQIYRKYTGRHSAHVETNENGNRLINLAASRNMVLRSTRFE